MTITPENLLNLGLNKLLEYLEYNVDQLHELMVYEGITSLDALADYLSGMLGICQCCFQEFCSIQDTIYCPTCESNTWNMF